MEYTSGNLVDDAARILASPIPRRQAVKALSRILTGSLFAAFGVRSADAQRSPCGNSTCAAGQICCTASNGRQFCGTGTCCDTISCEPGKSCCTGPNQIKFCSSPAQTCCGYASCSSSQKCCPGGTVPFCADSTAICCGGVSCGQNLFCDAGRCRASNA